MYYKYQVNAKERGLGFALGREVFKALTKQNCHYCGAEPKQIMSSNGRDHGDYIYNGVDRVNNSKGYESDNVVACCGICNLMKRAMSAQEFIDHIEKIHSHIVEESCK